MTKDEARHLASVLSAWADGEVVQLLVDEGAKWVDLTVKYPVFTDSPKHYRIKPKPREFWVNLDSRVAMLAEDGWEPSGRDKWLAIKVREVLE